VIGAGSSGIAALKALAERGIPVDRDNELLLYRRVFKPGVDNLFFIGLLQPLGALMPLLRRELMAGARRARQDGFRLPVAPRAQAAVVTPSG
jgi:hypothetical protein